MRRFLLTIALTLVLAALLLEVLLRVFGLAAHVPEEVNLDGDRMYRPGMEAPYTAGGLGEIRGRYHINPQGWNSVLDYGLDDSARVRIAIIGDSYIEGMQGEVGSSIGRILEEQWDAGRQGPDSGAESYAGCLVHEYGKAGGNISDHALVYEKWVRGRYEHVFVLVTDDDLLQRQPWYMGRGEAYHGVSIPRKIYYSSAFLRYLGLNHKLGMRLKGMLNERIFGPGEATAPPTLNKSALDHLDGVVFLHERGKLDPGFTASHPCLEIRHELAPYNFGFDGHWNLNGRTNVAGSLLDYILAPAPTP